MNDPGLEEPIGETADHLTSDRKGEEDAAKEDEQAYLNPRSISLQNLNRPAAERIIAGGGSPRLRFRFLQ